MVSRWWRGRRWRRGPGSRRWLVFGGGEARRLATPVTVQTQNRKVFMFVVQCDHLPCVPGIAPEWVRLLLRTGSGNGYGASVVVELERTGRGFVAGSWRD